MAGQAIIKKDRSIARRLSVSLMITVGIVSFMTVGPIYYQEAQKNKKELEQKADDIIAYQIGVLAKPLWDLDRQATRIVGETIAQNELVARLIIKDYFGRVAFSYENPDLSGSIDRSAEVLHHEDFVGDVAISLTDKYWRSKNHNLLTSFVITIFFILCALTLVSGLLVRTYLRKPLDRLNTMVGAYAAGEFEGIDSYQPYTEFKPFTQVLDQMARQIVGQLKDLATAEEKYRSIFENAIEGMFQSSPQGRYYSVNPAMAELLGYASPAEMRSCITDIATQTYVSSDDRKRFNRLLEQQGRVIEFETDLRRKDGTVISVAISARAVRDAEGTILYYEGYLVDITRRKKPSRPSTRPRSNWLSCSSRCRSWRTRRAPAATSPSPTSATASRRSPAIHRSASPATGHSGPITSLPRTAGGWSTNCRYCLKRADTAANTASAPPTAHTDGSTIPGGWSIRRTGTAAISPEPGGTLPRKNGCAAKPITGCSRW